MHIIKQKSEAKLTTIPDFIYLISNKSERVTPTVIFLCHGQNINVKNEKVS